ncbi:hypothetical protein VPH35_051571 [Triticum aestivum]
MLAAAVTTPHVPLTLCIRVPREPWANSKTETTNRIFPLLRLVVHLPPNIAVADRRGFTTMAGLTAWMIWRHRNSVIFDKISPDTSMVVDAIKEEAHFWASAGAKGLKDFIRVT